MKAIENKRRYRFLPIIDGMIASEIVKTSSAVLVILSSIIVSHSFIKVLSKAVEGDISSDAIFVLLGLKLVATGTTLLSPSVFLAILMVLGRMYRDCEMDALAASGAGTARIYRSVFVVIIPLNALAAILSFQALPWSERQTQSLMLKEELALDVDNLVAGRFSESENGNFAFYIDKIGDDEKLWNIFVQNRRSDMLDVITSDSGFVMNSMDGRFIVLENGVRAQGVAGQANFTITEFSEYGVHIQRSNAASIEPRRRSLPSSVLWDSRMAADIAELQARLAIPLGMICLSAWAIPLARTSPGGGVYSNVFMAFLIYVIYGNLLKMLRVWITGGFVPAWISFFGVYMVLLLGMVFSLSRGLGGRWVISRIRSTLGV